MRRAWLLAVLLLGGGAVAASDAGSGPGRLPKGDAGQKGELSAEDREVMDELDLLQNLDAARNMDLLIEASKLR